MLPYNNLSARRVTGLVPLASSLAGTRLVRHKIGGVATRSELGAIENKAGDPYRRAVASTLIRLIVNEVHHLHLHLLPMRTTGTLPNIRNRSMQNVS